MCYAGCIHENRNGDCSKSGGGCPDDYEDDWSDDDFENAVIDRYESQMQDMREIENYEPRRWLWIQ